MRYNVRKEWLVDENDNIVVKPLRFWFEYFGIKPVKIPVHGNPGVYYQLFEVTKNSYYGERFITIQCGGYSLNHHNYESMMDKMFRTGNADFNVKLVDVD